MVTGAGGQLGKQLTRDFRTSNFNVIATNKLTLNLFDLQSMRVFFSNNEFDWIVNCAAFTNLDSAEKAKREECRIVNSDSVAFLADIVKNIDVKVIQMSTDSVFSSQDPQYFQVHDEPNPCNFYGETKARAEEHLKNTIPERSWIVRTSWNYGEWGGNFLNRILEKLANKEDLEVVGDQFGQPTWTRYIAEGIKSIIQGNIVPGTYHLAPHEYVSRAQFARLIAENVVDWDGKISETVTFNNTKLAPRPRHSLLEPSKEFLSGTGLGNASLCRDIKQVISLRLKNE